MMDNDNANIPGLPIDPYYIFHNFAYAVFYSLLSVDMYKVFFKTNLYSSVEAFHSVGKQKS